VGLGSVESRFRGGRRKFEELDICIECDVLLWSGLMLESTKGVKRWMVWIERKAVGGMMIREYTYTLCSHRCD
jgi:hypothetical protein